MKVALSLQPFNFNQWGPESIALSRKSMNFKQENRDTKERLLKLSQWSYLLLGFGPNIDLDRLMTILSDIRLITVGKKVIKSRKQRSKRRIFE